jgi:hypothetical protein
MYVVNEKEQGQTFAYWQSDLHMLQIETGEKDEQGNPVTVVLSDDATIEAFMPGGKWLGVEFPETVYGFHDDTAQRTLLRPMTADSEAFAAMTPQEQQEYRTTMYPIRWLSVLVTSLVMSWGFTKTEPSPTGMMWTRPIPVSEEGFADLPLVVCRLLLDRCTRLWAGGDHTAYVQGRGRQFSARV